MSHKVGVFIGSLRRDSLNRKMAHALIALAPRSLTFDIVELGALPLYNPDLDDDGTPPAAWSAFRAQVGACHAALFVTPEYNRSVPATIKNALDVGSRPFGKSVWNAKPAAIVSVSPGAMGGFGANHHLRQVLTALNLPCLQHPEAYVGGAAKLFDAQGALVNDDTRAFLAKFTSAFAQWVVANAAR